MSIFLRMKHWQLFGILVGIPMIVQIVMMISMIVNPQAITMFSIFPLVMIISMGAFFGWFYSLGTNLYKKLPSGTHMNINRFKFFLFFPAVYIIVFMGVMIAMMFNLSEGIEPNPIFFAIIVPLHLFAMFCMFFTLYFTSKSLKTVELQREASFSDYAGEFFLMWFYPIGIWFIQPRINELFKNKG